MSPAPETNGETNNADIGSPAQTTARTLAGLAVLWICLVLMFKAHTMSDVAAQRDKMSPEAERIRRSAEPNVPLHGVR